MKLVFAHGWASNPSIWNQVIDSLDHNNVSTINLGFFGIEQTEMPSEKFIGVGHSLGSLWLLKQHADKLAGLVSICGFNCFYNHIPIQVLDKMKANLKHDATSQLNEFWKNAGYTNYNEREDICTEKLIEGLDWLSTWQTDIPNDLSLKVLASRNDQIVSNKMTKDIWKSYFIEWNHQGGHMLPLTQPTWCAKKIQGFVDALK